MNDTAIGTYASNDIIALYANEPFEGVICTGDIVDIGFSDSYHTNRFSGHWVVVLEVCENGFRGITLIAGWYCGPREAQLVEFTRESVISVCDPAEVSKEIQEINDWRNEQKQDHEARCPTSEAPSKTEDIGSIPF